MSQTYNNIIDFFETTVINHGQLGDGHFFFGQPYNLVELDLKYAHIILQPIPITMTLDKNSYKFRLFYLDIVDASLNNLNDVLSDGTQVISDILNELISTNEDYFINNNFVLNNFEEKFDDLTAGWWVDITIDTPRQINNCITP